MDFSAQLDVLQTNVAEAKAAAEAAGTDSRDQLRQRIDLAQVDVKLGVEDAEQQAGTAADSVRGKWAGQTGSPADGMCLRLGLGRGRAVPGQDWGIRGFDEAQAGRGWCSVGRATAGRAAGRRGQRGDGMRTDIRTDIPERTDLPEPGALGLRVLRREAGRWWWAPLVAGVIWFIIAWLVLRADVTSLATVGVLVGVAFLIGAVNEAGLAGFMTGGWRVLHYVMAAVFVLGGVYALVHPINTFFALASVLGLLLFLQGLFYITLGIAMRYVSPYWWVELITGVLLTLLAIWVSTSDRLFGLEGRTVFILVWVGFMAVFRGISDIVLAFSVLWYAKMGDGRKPDRATDTPQRILVQEHEVRAANDSPRR